MKVSVIMPAYNAEEYIEEAIDSVLAQTLDSYELIVVDDGSKDGTGAILDQYAQQYEQVKVIHQENAGVSAARNQALAVAQGEYYNFLDSDDIMESNALELLYQAAKEQDADLVIARYDMINRLSTVYRMPINTLFDEPLIDPFNTEILWTFSLWNKLFRADLVKKEDLCFPPVSYSEDGVFTMRFVHAAQRITGIEDIVYHYRRLPGDESNSISANVSVSKIKDYTEAHRMIYDILKNAVRKKYPQYSSVEEIQQEVPEMDAYLNEFLRKEVQILINQFYSKFWTLSKEELKLITDEIKLRISEMNLCTLTRIISDNPTVNILDLDAKQQDDVEDAFFTVALYGKAEEETGFLQCLKSLANQNFIALCIVIPASMESAAKEAGLWIGNIRTIEEPEKAAFYQAALDCCHTPWILFTDNMFYYSNNTFSVFFNRVKNKPVDYISELIYNNAYGNSMPVYYSLLMNESNYYETGDGENMCFDRLLPNHLFKVSFLRHILQESGLSLENCMPEIQKKGYLLSSNNQIVFFNEDPGTYLSVLNSPEAEKRAEEVMKDVKIASLADKALERRAEDVCQKYWPFEHESASVEEKIQRCISKYQNRPIKNQVLFISFRKNGKLEENLEEVYKKTRGKKVIFASQVPHTASEELKIYKLLLTSKVIITDDYVRNMRNIKLREEQKFIQIWHACGAFKQFGLRGTTLTPKSDMSIHSQYNLVSVSSSDIRWIYADAFAVPIRNVQALGAPRTDIYFDADRLEQARKNVFSQYPQWKGKRIILYAPTFRDRRQGREEFHPPLDFDQLSRNLPDDCVFVLRPHPHMKNKIVEKEYPNIVVSREGTTTDFMIASDLLVTDYSSVIFEYCLLKKPILFFCYDLQLYERGFYLQYPDDLPGDIYRTQEEIEEYFNAPEWTCDAERYDSFRKKYMSACDGTSSERIATLMNQYLGV